MIFRIIVSFNNLSQNNIINVLFYSVISIDTNSTQINSYYNENKTMLKLKLVFLNKFVVHG